MSQAIGPRANNRVTDRIYNNRKNDGQTGQEPRQAKDLVVKKKQKETEGRRLYAFGNLSDGKHKPHAPSQHSRFWCRH